MAGNFRVTGPNPASLWLQLRLWWRWYRTFHKLEPRLKYLPGSVTGLKRPNHDYVTVPTEIEPWKQLGWLLKDWWCGPWNREFRPTGDGCKAGAPLRQDYQETAKALDALMAEHESTCTHTRKAS